MNRRDFVKTVGTVGVGSAMAQTPPVLAKAKTAEPRQVIVILGESVRYDMLKCNKVNGLKTLNLGRIARGGMRFERGYYKLAVNLMTVDELCDLEQDPFEMRHLILSAEHTAIRNDLHDRLLKWMDETRDPFRGYYWGTRPWRPEFVATWKGEGMTRNRASDGYLPRELEYETGLTMVEATRAK